MSNRLRRGASVQQYALMLGLVAVVALLSITLLGSQVGKLMTRASNTIDGAMNGAGASTSSGGGGGGAQTGRDCAAIKSANPAAASGAYVIQPAATSYTVWCDMATDGGGWTLISKFSGTESGSPYYLDPGFNTAALANTSTSGTTNNAKLPNADIYAIIGARRTSAVTFRAVSALYDTQIQVMQPNINPFDTLAAGDLARCKQSTDAGWYDYSMSTSGCQTFRRADEQVRVSTWTQGCFYVSTPCGDAQMFSMNGRYHQYIDGGYTSTPTRPGIWYIR